MADELTELRRRVQELERRGQPAQEMGGDGGGAGGVVPVKLTAKSDDTTYTGDVYANGSDATATETGVTIRVRDLATGETLPTGRWFAASQQPWAGVSVWTLVEVPRLL